MAEEKKITQDKEQPEKEAQIVEEVEQALEVVEAKDPSGEKTLAEKIGGKSSFAAKLKRVNRPRGGKEEKKEEFEQRILDLARVTRVMAGGKRMSFRACVAIGDKKGRIAVGLGKGADVTLAVNKAVNKAKKNIIQVPIKNDTIPHEITKKTGAARIMFKPAGAGRGVIAGGVVRVIIELAGIKNITSKILGTSNKVSNAQCVIEALRELKSKEEKKEVKSEIEQTNKA